MANVQTPSGWESSVDDVEYAVQAAPMADLCYLGGWKSPLMVMTVYQQADQVTMRKALSNRDQRRAIGRS